MALQSIGEKSEVATAAFLVATHDSEHELRLLSLQCIRQYSSMTDAVSKALIERMKDSNEWVQKEAITAAVAMKMDSKVLFPALKEALANKSSLAARETASNMLKDLGDPALPVLIECLDHEDAGVRYSAVWSLGFFGPAAHSATEKLLRILQADPDASVRARAAAAIGAIAVPSDKVATALTKSIGDDDNKHVRVRAKEAFDLIVARKKNQENK